MRNEKRNKPNLIHISNKYPPTKILECLLMLYMDFFAWSGFKRRMREKGRKRMASPRGHTFSTASPRGQQSRTTCTAERKGEKTPEKANKKKKTQQKLATARVGSNRGLRQSGPLGHSRRGSRGERRVKEHLLLRVPIPPHLRISSEVACTTPVPSSSSTAPAPLLNVERKPDRPAP
jgi:hypothetical protein